MQLSTSVSARLMVSVMALCPVSLAVLCHTGLRSAPLSIDFPKLPAVAFHQYAVDLRKIHPSSEAHATFVFQNRGSEPVRITKMEPSCACLSCQLQGARNNSIEAGELGRIVLKMQPANSTTGPHEYTVNVHYTDPEPREVQLVLKLVIPETTITISPPALVVYHPAGSEPTVKDFVITDGRGTPFDITDLSINTDLVDAVIGDTSRTPTGKFQQSVRVAIAGDLPPGRTQVLLRIGTTDPDFPEIRVPIMLQGPVLDNDLDHNP